jgi:hypothetical protein
MLRERLKLLVKNLEERKKCSKCKSIKNLEEFSKDKSKSDGLTSACRECNNNREKKRRGNGGDFTKMQKKAAFIKCGCFCQICGSKSNLQIDHKLPQHVCEPYRASNDENAWVLCKGCNIAKGTRIIIEVIKEISSANLEPMLLQEYAIQIKQGLYEKVTVPIGGKLFTEVKLKSMN